jgi:hypothetical protein
MAIPVFNIFFIHSAHFAGHLVVPTANQIRPIIVKHPAKNPNINSIIHPSFDFVAKPLR